MTPKGGTLFILQQTPESMHKLRGGQQAHSYAADTHTE